MKKIIWKILLVAGTSCLVFQFCFAWDGDIKEIHKEIELTGEKNLLVKMDLGGGVIDLRKNNTGNILEAEIEYDPDKVDTDIDYRKIGDKGKLYLYSKSEDVDFDPDDNYWHLGFTDEIPIELEMDIGACEAEFDFTGLKISKLNLDLGASSSEMIFRKPNPERIFRRIPLRGTRIDIDVGASELKMKGLGNANFDKFSFDGGVGDFTLGFSGELKHKAYVDIDVGLGSLSILLPKDIGVRIEKEDSFLSSFSIDAD
ncbi:MAG: toast rack family protein, partial [Candidatus Zixiibacteriota bacterium]